VIALRQALLVLLFARGASASTGDESRSADARLAAGIARAKAGDLSAALDDFIAVRERASGETWECATFDASRALHERATARPLPEAPPAHGPIPVGEVANVRARLAAARGDLEAARLGLLELLARVPEDQEARAGLARIAGALREVLALDAAWKARGTPRADASRQGESMVAGPLREGPSATRAAAGAPGRRGGAADEGAGETPLGAAASSVGRLDDGRLTEEDAKALLERLRQIREERRAYDERRGDAAAARLPRRS
jgi:hypothetical protein